MLKERGEVGAPSGRMLLGGPHIVCSESVQDVTWATLHREKVSRARPNPQVFMKSVELLVELASLQTAFLTLDAAIKTTNRRVNALDNVVRPRLENTISYIKARPPLLPGHPGAPGKVEPECVRQQMRVGDRQGRKGSCQRRSQADRVGQACDQGDSSGGTGGHTTRLCACWGVVWRDSVGECAMQGREVSGMVSIRRRSAERCVR